MKENKVFIAAAGSGKTRYLVEEALKITEGNVLITTYTNNNEEQIRRRIIDQKGYIPNNIIIKPWYSFLLQHGVRPYQGGIFESKIKGVNLINGISSKGVEKTDIKRYYFDSKNRMYPDKLSDFILKCNNKHNGRVIDRISKIFTYIFIDEFQDLAGYDLDMLNLFFKSASHTLLVGDPRQTVYSTNKSRRHKRYRMGEIVEFFNSNEVKGLSINIDKDSLNINYRCNTAICNFSNRVFPEHESIQSKQEEVTGHDGIFLVKNSDVVRYLKKYSDCVQLRYDRKAKGLVQNYQSINFGGSKGLEFNRVLIFPTESIKKWLKNGSELEGETRCKLYVAITRAKYSVAIVCGDREYNNISDDLLEKWVPDQDDINHSNLQLF